ncbi:hypothetical protein [Streptomyces microflavus]|uniref:hypothetical protein n=1 Tax=Streptomyces microflavus TaxID=1919 RepID=UPI003B2115D1
MDGAFAGRDYYGARQVQIDAAIRVPGNPAACHDIIAALQADADNEDVRLAGGVTMPLRILRPGRPVKRLDGRLRRVDPEFRQVIHGYVPSTWSSSPPTPGSTPTRRPPPRSPRLAHRRRVRRPVVAPIYVQSGTVAANRPGWANNQGTSSAWPIIRITGPVATVTVIHAESGRQLSFPTLVLTVGQWIEIDTRPGYRTIRRENGGNAASLLAPHPASTSSPSPGQSEMRWTGFDNTNAARMRLTWRDAYTAL